MAFRQFLQQTNQFDYKTKKKLVLKMFKLQTIFHIKAQFSLNKPVHV